MAPILAVDATDADFAKAIKAAEKTLKSPGIKLLHHASDATSQASIAPSGPRSDAVKVAPRPQ